VEPVKIAVVGTVRNVSRQLEKEIKVLKQALEPIGDVAFFVVESDSLDATKRTLDLLVEKYKNFTYKSLGDLEPSIPDRIERLIFCRNVYVQEIRKSKHLSQSDFVIVVDLDGINKKLKAESVKLSLSRKENWDVICANQTRKYYDLLALRHKFWCPQNVFDEYYWLRGVLTWKKAKKYTIYNKMIRIPREYGLISVDSAFGGFAIYKTRHFMFHDYTRLPRDSHSDIDHVIFNRRIIESGGNIFIDSQLINAHWTKHSLSSFPMFRGLANFKKRLMRYFGSTRKLR